MSISTFPQTSLGGAAAAVVDKIASERSVPEPFAPGIYFGLSAEAYHADIALGSSDIRKLAKSPQDFWYSSRFNPHKEEEEDDTDAKTVGTAMHLMILEGREALERKFAPAWHPGNVKAGKEERAAIIANGREPIKGKFWERILIGGSIIRGNRYLGGAFQQTIGTEVSVFWRDRKTDMPKKARLDALKPRAVVDLKSIVNRDHVDFVSLCRKHIGVYGYYVQAAHYLDAWREMAALVDAGAIFDAPPGTEDRLSAASRRDAAAFVFVFTQKTGAPLAWGTQISPGNGILDIARNVITRAEDNWRTFVERHGLYEPWLLEEPLDELDINDIPPWTLR